LGTLLLWLIGSLFVFNFFQSRMAVVIYSFLLLILLGVLLYKPINALQKKTAILFNGNTNQVLKNNKTICQFEDIDCLVIDEHLQDDRSIVIYSLYLALKNEKKIELTKAEDLQQLKQITVDLTNMFAFRLRVERFMNL